MVKRRDHWPFLYYEEGGRMYMNPARRSVRRDHTDVGEALL